jgi:halimadienyl-diphosphate synthase
MVNSLKKLAFQDLRFTSVEQDHLNLPLQPRNMALVLLEQLVADQNETWGGGEMTAAAYDTAWVAMVRDPHHPNQLAFPQALNWLLKHQAIDGSWSRSSPYPYALLPTLAGLLALLKAPAQTESIRYAASRAEAYLRTSFSQWSVKKHESVGFEVLAPKLLQELEKLGVFFEFPDKAELLELYAEKMLIAGPDLIYSGQSNLIHSLEAFGSSLDFKRLKRQQSSNGSYGCSPAATAAVLIYGSDWDNAAADWLTYLSNRAFDGVQGGMPNAYPIDAFEGAWVLYNLALGGFNLERDFPKQLLQNLYTWLQQCLTPQGASISRFIGIPIDSDDTGMVLAALNKAGVKVPVDSILHFERSEHFSCFEKERGASMSANAHVLAALLSLPKAERNYLSSSIRKLVNFLYSIRDKSGFWEDKWHLSPFYATACAVMALVDYEELSVQNNLQSTINWVLQSQSSKDGGWGYCDYSTLEETAYALQILQAVPHLIEPSDYLAYKRAIYRGVKYLWQHLDEYYPDYGAWLPKLWRGKELYTPSRVVFSAVIAVLNQFNR